MAWYKEAISPPWSFKEWSRRNILKPPSAFLQSLLLLSSDYAQLESSEQGITLIHVAYSGWPLGTQHSESQLENTQCGEQFSARSPLSCAV